MIKRLSLFLTLVCMPLFGANAAIEEERRIALVIGNADYVFSPLANPARDAADMSATLRDLGFEVTTLLNADLRQMRRAAIDFGRALDDGGVGLFYYAGHGVQVDGQNYLIPLGAAIDYEEHVGVEALSVQQVLSRMGGARNRMNIVILDACRNNPLKRSMRSAQTGLAQMDAPTGTYIAYATAPGQTAADGAGDNGLYTEALLNGFKKRGLQIETVFKDVRKEVIARTDGKQVPWSASSITGDFVFNLEAETIDLEFEDTGDARSESKPDQNPQSAGLRVTPLKDTIDLEREKAFWDAVSSGDRAEDYQAYLDEYPDGIYTRLARLRLKGKPVVRPQPVPVQTPEPARTAPKPALVTPVAPATPSTTPTTVSLGRFDALPPKPGKSRIVGALTEVAGDTRIEYPMTGYLGREKGWLSGEKMSMQVNRMPDGRLRYHGVVGRSRERIEGYLVLEGGTYSGVNSLPFFTMRNKAVLKFYLEE